MKRNLRKQEFIAELVSLHIEAHQLGLRRTGRALLKAVGVVGWEVARQIEQKGKPK